MKNPSVRKYLVGILSILLVSVQCSKKEDPAPTPGCNFTFKGTSYTFQVSVCDDNPTIGGQFNSGTNLTATYALLLTKDGSADGIVFTDVASLTAYGSSVTGGSHTITISGNTWTFSGTLVSSIDNTITGAISGTCTCTTNP